jgi:hypothetical protein
MKLFEKEISYEVEEPEENSSFCNFFSRFIRRKSIDLVLVRIISGS